MRKIFMFSFLAVTISINAQTFQTWNRKQAITINSSLVEGPSPLVDFPFLVTLDYLDEEVIDGGINSALNGGGDIRFSSDIDGNNPLAIEIVEFITNSISANRKCQIWVKINSLLATSDTTIYIWYNKPGVTQPLVIDPYGSQAVWAGYEAVWHMEDDPSASAPQIIDVTGNGYDLLSSGGMAGTDIVNGAIGNGVLFDGVNDFFTLTNELTIDNSFTFSAWYNWDSSDSDGGVILADGPPYYVFYLSDDIDLAYYGGAGESSDIYTSAGSISQDTMQKWDFVATNGGVQNYLNSNVLTANKTSGVESGGVNYIGADSTGDYMKGWLDEIRMSSDSKSADWVKTEYENQTNAAGFASAGAPEAVTPLDTEAPSSPVLSSTAQTNTSIDLSWTVATDDTAVTSYKIYKDGALEATLGNVLNYQVAGLTVATAYNFTITALDDIGNESVVSNLITISTNGVSVGGLGNWSLNGQDIYYNDGSVGIGTDTPDEKLAVNGTIHSKKVKVDLNNWPDYVFAKDYNLPSLEDVEKYIKEKGHLQNIPSTKDVQKNGIFLGEMNAKLLEKIEELTLYIIQQQKELEFQKEKNGTLEKRLSKLETLLEKIVK